MAGKNVKEDLKNPFILDEGSEKAKQRGDYYLEYTPIKIKVGEKEEEVEHRIPKKKVFERYKELSEISVLIAKELIGDNAYRDADISNLSYNEIRNDGLTFFMSSESGYKHTGLLSLCPALLTGIKLYDEMPESETRTMLLLRIKTGIDAVFKFIYRDDDWRKNHDLIPVFDASPYESDAFYPGDNINDFSGRSYIDSISWVTFLFLRIMNYVDKKDKGKKFEEYREEAKKLIKWCLSYVNNAILTVELEDDESEEEEKVYKRPVGWSFSKISSSSGNAEARRSLYFTYAAASMYLAFYDEYKDIIDNLMTLNRKYEDKDINEEGNIRFPLRPEYHKNKFKQAEEAIKTFESKMDKPEHVNALDELKKALKVLQKADENDLKDYFYFNDEKSAEYNGKYYEVSVINDPKSLGSISRFKWNLEIISTDLWKKAKEKDKLENNFVYDDFNFNEANEEAIKSGGQTNALFAGLMQISICLYSTYDLVILYTKDDDTRRFGQEAYEDMQNTMLLHVQKVQRFFDELENEGKAFSVDSLTLRFSEDYSKSPNKKGNCTDRELAEKLRKQSIHITSLTPMLLKTNNLISNYVIKYPQKQMGASLIRVGKKRFYDKNSENEKYRWFWDADGYHAMSNYYYVGAIYDFYAYYRAYEKEYIDRYENLRETLIKDLDFSDSVRKYYQKKDDEMAELRKYYDGKIAEKDKDIEKIKAEANESAIGEDLVSNINEIIETSKYFDNPMFLRKIIKGIRKQLATELAEWYKRIPNVDEAVLAQLSEPLEPKKDKKDKFFPLLQALAADIILPSAIEATKYMNTGGKIKEIGNDKFDLGLPVADFAREGGEMLINGGLIDKLFLHTLENLSFSK